MTRCRVLVLAHCTAGFAPNFIEIRAGSTFHGSGGHSRFLNRFINHPFFSSATLRNDISILQFVSPLNTNLPSISAINLPPRDISAAVGSLSQVSGWGAVCEGCSFSSVLRFITIPIISNFDCNRVHGGSVTEGMMCAAHPNGTRDACQGDSGGPLTFNNVLEGIVSWGLGCARPNSAGVYTRVSFYRDWIDVNINEF